MIRIRQKKQFLNYDFREKLRGYDYFLITKEKIRIEKERIPYRIRFLNKKYLGANPRLGTLNSDSLEVIIVNNEPRIKEAVALGL